MQKDHHFPSCAISRRQLRIWYIINQGFTLDPLYPKRRGHFYSCADEVPFPVCYESWLLFMAFKRCTYAPLLPPRLFSNLDSPFLQWLYVVRGFRIFAPSPSPRGVLFQKRTLSNNSSFLSLLFRLCRCFFGWKEVPSHVNNRKFFLDILIWFRVQGGSNSLWPRRLCERLQSQTEIHGQHLYQAWDE